MRKLILALVIVSLVLMIVVGLTIKFAGSESLPIGEREGAAELAARIEKAVNVEAWRKKTAAVEFTFVSGNNRHFYDKKRKLYEVRFNDVGDDILVQHDPVNYRTLVLRDNQPVTGRKKADYLESARLRHHNDLFWLNPFATLQSPGIALQKIGERALLATYTAGGVTPGDSYLFVLDKQGRPEYFKLWVGIVPLKGIRASFDGWITTETGAKLSLVHKTFIRSIDLKDVKTYGVYPPPGTKDRFGDLLKLPKMNGNSGK